MKLLTLLVLFCANVSLMAANHPKARMISKLKKCVDIARFKEDVNVIYIHKNMGGKLTYGNFENDTNPDTVNTWTIFDILYEDVPLKYEAGLAMLAKGEYASAKALFESSKNEKTPSKKVFSKTDICKNYLDEKLLQCALNLNNKDEAKGYFKKILANKSAHARIRVMMQYIPFLIKEGKGKDAQKYIEICLKMPLSKKIKFELSINRCIAISLQKKYSKAKAELKDIENKMLDSHSNGKELVKNALTTILIYHEKNYKEGIRYFLKLLAEDRINFSSDSYLKLAECYLNTRKYEDARWNLIQAYLSEKSGTEVSKTITDKILAVNDKIPSEKGNMSLDQFFKKVKKTH